MDGGRDGGSEGGSERVSESGREGVGWSEHALSVALLDLLRSAVLRDVEHLIVERVVHLSRRGCRSPAARHEKGIRLKTIWQ